MERKIKRIVFFGHNQWAVLTLRALLERGFSIPLVVTETTEFDHREAENYRRFAEFGAYGDVAGFAEKQGLAVQRPEQVNTSAFAAEILGLRPDLVLCVSYHAIFKKVFREAFSGRLINAHVAPLPFYRGRAPLNWAIINDEKRHGLTVHFIDRGIDTGPILHQEFCPIHESDRAIDLLARLLPLFPIAVLSAIEKIERGEPGIPQDPFAGSYYPRRTPADGEIDFSRESGRDIYNKVRALAYPYPGAFFFHRNEKFLVNRCGYQNQSRPSPVPGIVFRRSPQSFHVSLIDGSLEIFEILRPGGRIVTGEALPPLFPPGTRLVGEAPSPVLPTPARS